MKFIIHTFSDKEHIGDNNQVKGVLKALKKTLAENQREYEVIESMGEEVTSIESTEETRHILIAAGHHGFKKINELKAQNQDLFAIGCAHQYFEEFDFLSYFPDICALPQGVLSEEQRVFLDSNSKLIETQGVSHQVDDETVQKAVAGMTFDPSKKIVAVMLAGDAPNEEEEMQYFSPKEARIKAREIFEVARSKMTVDENTLFLITNGPRTGKYNAETHELRDPNPHETGQVDATTFAFVDELNSLFKKANLPETNISLEDFKFGQKKSAYLPIMAYVSERKGLYFVPSESTSMVTESAYAALHGAEVVVYRTESENTSHAAHLMQSYGAGQFAILDKDGRFLAKNEVTLIEGLSAAQQITDAILKAQLAIDLETEERRIEMDSEIKPDVPAITGDSLENGDNKEEATAPSFLQRAWDHVPSVPEAVKEQMTWKNGAIVGAGVLLAGAGMFALSQGKISIPSLSTDTPSPSK